MHILGAGGEPTAGGFLPDDLVGDQLLGDGGWQGTELPLDRADLLVDQLHHKILIRIVLVDGALLLQLSQVGFEIPLAVAQAFIVITLGDGDTVNHRDRLVGGHHKLVDQSPGEHQHSGDGQQNDPRLGVVPANLADGELRAKRQ